MLHAVQSLLSISECHTKGEVLHWFSALTCDPLCLQNELLEAPQTREIRQRIRDIMDAAATPSGGTLPVSATYKSMSPQLRIKTADTDHFKPQP